MDNERHLEPIASTGQSLSETAQLLTVNAATLSALHPADKPRTISDINWQAQHYRCNETGAIMKRLADLHRDAQARGARFFCSMQAESAKRQDATGPYSLVPLWDSERHTLEIEIHRVKKTSSDDKALLTITLPAPRYKEVINEYIEATQQGRSTRNSAIRARELGGDTIRETLRERHLEASDSLAKALFVAMAELEQRSHKKH